MRVSQYWVNTGSIRGQYGVNTGSIRGQYGVNTGSIRGQLAQHFRGNLPRKFDGLESKDVPLQSI